MENRRIRVAYLGPEATFTHEAAVRHFGKGADFIPVSDIVGIFDEAESGRVDAGVVPIENALEGTVNITLDRLFRSSLRVVGEVSLPIDIHLLTRAKSLEAIERVMSHYHAVAQCRRWLRENLPGAQIEEVASTALAAKMAAESENLAALGSRMAGAHYGLRVLVEKLDTESINVTRFFVLGHEVPPPTGKDRTSIIFTLPNEAGALYRAFGPLAERGINMTKIESRPSRQRAWEYVFFMDVEGHAEDK
ncbi:MAG: prephenate dehydratase, partial [bacterium]|nr:prephenate dehydratase [bacterium]